MKALRHDPTKRSDIYFKKEELCRRSLAKTALWPGSPRNKELLKDYQQSLFAGGAKNVRVAKISYEIRKVCDHMKKDLDTFTSKDVEAYIAHLNQRDDISHMTKTDYKHVLKAFFRWYEDEDERLVKGNEEERLAARKLYKYINNLKCTHKSKEVNYSEIITEEDNISIIRDGCENAQERALIAFLHETGVRVGELLGVRLRDIERKEQHAMVRVDGKTGERRVPIVQSLPWIMRWLDEHPAKDNPDALLWLSKYGKYYGHPLRYVGVQRLLQRTMSRAGINKPCNAHHFRHSRATLIAPKYSETILCRLMGWELGSKMVKTYVHTSGSQVEDAFLKTNGLKQKDEEKPIIRTCVCGTTNTPDASYCYKCGKAMDTATFIQDEAKKGAAIDEAFELLGKIMSDSDLRERFAAWKAEQATSK